MELVRAVPFETRAAADWDVEPGELYEEALDSARLIADPAQRVAEMVGYVDGGGDGQLVAEIAETARAIEDPKDRSRALLALALAAMEDPPRIGRPHI
jgi:hypothetical protein